MRHEFYICEIIANGQTFRFSSGGDVTVGSFSYVDGLKIDSVSSEEARITIPNSNLIASSLFLNYTVRESSVTISHVSDQTRTIFKGFGDNLIRLDAESAQIRAVGNASYSYFTDKRVEPPDFNYITKDGTEIVFGNYTITIGNNNA